MIFYTDPKVREKRTIRTMQFLTTHRVVHANTCTSRQGSLYFHRNVGSLEQQNRFELSITLAAFGSQRVAPFSS